MICKILDTLSRFKDSSNYDYNSRIASLMAKPDNQRTKEENQELTISIIQEMVRKENNEIENNSSLAEDLYPLICNISDFYR